MSTPFQISLAPDQLWQAINPMDLLSAGRSIRPINIDLGDTGESDLERKILDKVGSYGRQIGRIGDALEVILKHVKLGNLTPDEQDALDILKGQLAAVRQAKAGARRERRSQRVKHDAIATAMIKRASARSEHPKGQSDAGSRLDRHVGEAT